MTICRQNGDVNFVGVPTGEKGVFVRAGLLSPSPPSNPENIFLGAVYRSPSLCDGDRLHSPYTKRLPCAGVCFLGAGWSCRGLAERKKPGCDITDSVGQHAPSTRKPSGPAGPEGFLVEGACCPTLSVMSHPGFFLSASPLQDQPAPKKQTPAQGRRLVYGL